MGAERGDSRSNSIMAAGETNALSVVAGQKKTTGESLSL